MLWMSWLFLAKGERGGERALKKSETSSVFSLYLAQQKRQAQKIEQGKNPRKKGRKSYVSFFLRALL